uniref:TatD related DNase n=1 Tax=Odontella aurita TaxID=265563 RepID=A0A7S4N6C6_9STRA
MAECLGRFAPPATARDAPPSCPCCAFLLDDEGGRGGGIFLPPPCAREDLGRDRDFGGIAFPAGDLETMSPSEALLALRSAAAAARASEEDEGRATPMLVDTHGHPHLERESAEVYSGGGAGGGGAAAPTGDGDPPEVISLTCAVSQSDWDDALEYSAESDRILPALGVHPWYLPSLSPDYLEELERLLILHPRALVGEIGLCKVARFVREYPEERGGKTAAMEWQRRVFREQFQLAAKLRRPCTVHCVRQHGVFMAVMKQIRDERMAEIAARRKRIRRREASEAKTQTDGPDGSPETSENASGSAAHKDEGELVQTLADAFPPAIAMHSFTGTAHHVNEILKFEESLFGDSASSVERRGIKKKKKNKSASNKTPAGSPKKKDGDSAGRPPLFYFGFSHIVNVAMCSSSKSRRQGVEAVRAVPPDRLLAESDVHSSLDVGGGTAGSVAYLAASAAGGSEGESRGDGLAEMARLTARNGLDFLGAAGRRMDGAGAGAEQ